MTLRSGDVVGLIGRTGSGKSTSILALLRLVPITQGRIFIGGVDTRTVSRADVRRAVAVIPQQPVLFNGSIRFNLDPMGEHTDTQLRSVLSKCHLPPGGSFALDARVSEDGANLSAGERQLLCVARALLRRCRVVCVDEATSAADPATERLVTELVATAFAGSTVIIVAHRLATLHYCTRVVELRSGTIVNEGPASYMIAAAKEAAGWEE